MSQDDLNVLAQLSEAFNRDGWEGMVPFLAADFEFHEPPEQPGATVFRGREEARQGWARWAEAWSQQTSELREVRELDDGRVFVVTRATLHGRDGIEVKQDSFNIFTIEIGKVRRWASFWDRANALTAAGLEG
jgi:ketosteroid isomerase-like protein